uniref:hypothetical protein n=1 Tax=Nocardia paucivorans TaxID=114259 RepID=UPI0002F8BC59|nr:hypothetical protein [Nocardia paucivorans]
MDHVFEIAMLVIMMGALAGMLALVLRGRRGARMPEQAEVGTLYLTGVSPRPDAMGEQFVTLTGNLTGPTVPGTVVYGRFVWDAAAWPSIGDTLTVVYPPGKPQQWQIARPGAGNLGD